MFGGGGRGEGGGGRRGQVQIQYQLGLMGPPKFQETSIHSQFLPHVFPLKYQVFFLSFFFSPQNSAFIFCLGLALDGSRKKAAEEEFKIRVLCVSGTNFRFQFLPFLSPSLRQKQAKKIRFQ